MPREVGIRSFFFGLHNPLFHTAVVALGWRLIYNEWPRFREFVCIVLHDIGYLKIKNGLDVDGDDHPVLGAQICGRIMGREGYELCIAHSREFANKEGLKLSKLGYADKYWPFLLSDRLFKWIITIGGEAGWYNHVNRHRRNPPWGYPIEVPRIKADYAQWWMRKGAWTGGS